MTRAIQLGLVLASIALAIALTAHRWWHFSAAWSAAQDAAEWSAHEPRCTAP